MKLYGIFDSKAKKLIRKGFTWEQASSMIAVHQSDCLDDGKKPWLVLYEQNITEYQPVE